jgi:hypothetical protein
MVRAARTQGEDPMTLPSYPAEQIGEWFLGQLSAARSGGSKGDDYAAEAIEALPVLHASTPDGRLPRQVQGRDFVTEAARLLNDVRDQVRYAAALIAVKIEDVRSDELQFALERRSALQYLKDDFQSTVAEGLVDDDLFDEDPDLAEKIREFGPLPAAAIPRHIPPSHWWWAQR